MCDLSVLFPPPATLDQANALISATAGEGLWPKAAFERMVEFVTKDPAAAVTHPNGQVRRIVLPEPLRDRASWKVTGFRVDPGAPGGHSAIVAKFGRAPQLRLVLQPVTDAGGGPQVHDVTAHLVFNFVLAPEKAEEGFLPVNVPDLARFNEVLKDLLELKGWLKGQGVDTDRVPLGVHPGLKGGVPQAAEFGRKLLAFLTRHAAEKNLTAMAMMGLPHPNPEPWVFVAAAKKPDGTWGPAPIPALGFKSAEMLSFADGQPAVVPAPQPTNRNPVSNFLRTPPADRRGVATAALFAPNVELDATALVGVGADGAALFDPATEPPLRNRDIPDLVANPEVAHFFNTDCVSCHTESTRRKDLKLPDSPFRYRRLTGVSGVDPAVLPDTRWNVRTFGWFPTPTGPRATVNQRAANETADCVAFVNRVHLGQPDPVWGAGLVHPDQGWGRELTQRFYHASEGTFLIPLSWAVALARLEKKESLFELVKEFGVLPDDRTPDLNPDGLPVGFAVDQRYDRPWLGITCALCHTGELRHGGRVVRVPGGSSPLDYVGLVKSLYGRLVEVSRDAGKFMAFAAAVGGDEAKLKAELTEVAARAGQFLALGSASLLPLEHGPYRLDALNLGAVNLVLSGYAAQPSAPGGVPTVVADVPVSYPSLWHGPWRDAVQYAVAIRSPLARNAVQALSTSFVPGPARTGAANPANPPQPDAVRNLHFPNLFAIEEWLRDLAPPPWPEEAFGRIDRDRADRGRRLYREHCASCHNWDTTPATAGGLPLFKTVVVPQGEVGTDPLLLDRFRGADGRMALLRARSNALIDAFFATAKVSPQARQSATLGKENEWAVRGGYGATPLDGVWATAPYLHNGSVPTLWELLLPAAERPRTFNLGDREFDPVRVGVKSAGRFVFDTTKPGNSNAGHEYPKGRRLSDAERLELIEYLKAARQRRPDGR
ncbi:MAG: di-heme-cytochrome C peroxidase [Gemmataceae bacterium]